MTIALLVPLPAMHLEAARGRLDTIAMGTRAWETLRQFVGVGGPNAPVLIYASMNDEAAHPVVSWTGVFGEYREAGPGGLVPRRWQRFRPETMTTEDEHGGHWAGYFTVERLRELSVPRPITDLRLWSGDVPPARSFIPHGPTIVTMERELA